MCYPLVAPPFQPVDDAIVPLNVAQSAGAMPAAMARTLQNAGERAIQRAGPKPLACWQPVATTVTGASLLSLAVKLST